MALSSTTLLDKTRLPAALLSAVCSFVPCGKQPNLDFAEQFSLSETAEPRNPASGEHMAVRTGHCTQHAQGFAKAGRVVSFYGYDRRCGDEHCSNWARSATGAPKHSGVVRCNPIGRLVCRSVIVSTGWVGTTNSATTCTRQRGTVGASGWLSGSDFFGSDSDRKQNE